MQAKLLHSGLIGTDEMKSYLLTYVGPNGWMEESELVAGSLKGACRRIRKHYRNLGLRQPRFQAIYVLRDDRWRLVKGDSPDGFQWRFVGADQFIDNLLKIQERRLLHVLLQYSH